ncbi:RHTO0S29e01376g1_1 [Rhodotorula toruloides]|uniref:RHTO0S29e01376g1_1 n=1 Tax=Rhodotorula toruloides TaxID=5286 RepID=A0A061BNU9_RHOTO|nr:RHTO0S29e01376g1_1 [Rhodotorula toruloides]
MATRTAAQTTAHTHTLDTALAQATLDNDDREEGEIDDEGDEERAGAEGAHAAQTVTVADTGPGRPPTATPALSTSALLAVKDQSKQIIAELLTYGVSPEYLLSVGVSRDILEISFHELNLDLAVPTVAPQAFPYFPPLATSLSAHATPFTPRSPLSPGRTASPPPVNPELAALEAQKRQQLLARKAALLARKQQQALESDVDALFAAAPSPATSSASAVTKETRSARRNRKKRKLMAAQAVHDLRESVDHTEETVDVPSPGPFVVAANAEAGPSSRYNSVARSSAQPTSTFVPTSVAGRPKATDLEGEPAHAMSSASLTKGHAAPAYIASASTRMIIELSDDESEEEEEQAGDGADEEMRDSTPSTSNSNLPSPSLAPSQPSRRSSRPPGGEADQAAAAAAAAEAAARAAKAELDERERKHRLEAKEREIRRMMERIAEMERRKKEARSKKGESASPAPQQTPPVAANGHAEQATVDAQPNDVQSVESSITTAAARATPTPAPVSEVPSQPPSSASSLFRPYQSSLSRYPLCRASAASDSASIRSTSLAPAADVPAPAPAESGKAGIASWVARKRGVDTSRRLCKAEAGGGRCHDTKCKSLHISSFVPTAEEVAEYEALERAVVPTSANDASQ